MSLSNADLVKIVKIQELREQEENYKQQINTKTKEKNSLDLEIQRLSQENKNKTREDRVMISRVITQICNESSILEVQIFQSNLHLSRIQKEIKELSEQKS